MRLFLNDERHTLLSVYMSTERSVVFTNLFSINKLQKFNNQSYLECCLHRRKQIICLAATRKWR